MNDTAVKTESVQRILGLLQELEDSIPAHSVAARRSLDKLVQRLSEPLPTELRSAVRQRNENWQPRLPR